MVENGCGIWWRRKPGEGENKGKWRRNAGKGEKEGKDVGFLKNQKPALGVPAIGIL